MANIQSKISNPKYNGFDYNRGLDSGKIHPYFPFELLKKQFPFESREQFNSRVQLCKNINFYAGEVDFSKTPKCKCGKPWTKDFQPEGEKLIGLCYECMTILASAINPKLMTLFKEHRQFMDAYSQFISQMDKNVVSSGFENNKVEIAPKFVTKSEDIIETKIIEPKKSATKRFLKKIKEEVNDKITKPLFEKDGVPSKFDALD